MPGGTDQTGKSLTIADVDFLFATMLAIPASHTVHSQRFLISASPLTVPNMV